ncbi:tetratricopeptide repeat protein [Luteolibacter pohnpeiensis]|uniref:Tetratricopeptide repeat protein n=1 Tax=Luteolibacter pohnpeiensis TaxID=454153 RepID=A0A934SFE9_9BACT|nr:tetratricopeptide repeat protein [Luteolibacter pohnpeiensis]MBK1884193.1 tetratricopeptide repeat protein [Luteolibacter pohnpeiensis]
MKSLTRMVLGLLAMGVLAHAGTVDAFKKANADYEAGRFAEAAQAYEGILKSDGPRASVLKNLGSAYFKAGDNGRAILAFERALVLSPRDPDLLANLELAQKQAAVFPEENPKGWQTVLTRYSARRWSELVLIAGIILPLLAMGWIFLPGNRRIGLAALAVLDLAMLGIAIPGLKAKTGESTRAIVLAKPATVRISPFETAGDRGTIAEGREVALGKQSHGYYWVSVDQGSLQGWVANQEIAPVIPREN